MIKRICVTGAGGYIGRHVVEKLLDQGIEIIAVDVKLDGIDDRAIKTDIDIFSDNENIYKELGEPDVCLHMAWRDGFVHNSDRHISDLPKHYMFIKNMLTGGLKQIAVMGSMHEVGYYEGAIDENTPTNPLSPYGIAKNSLRQLCEILAGQNGAVLQWIRGYYIYGDDLNNHSIFTKIVEAANEGKREFPFTSGKNLYDFMSVDELANQISAVITQNEVTGIINCCSGQPMSLADKVESFIKEHNFDIKLNYGAFPDRPYDSPGVWGDATKISQIMNSRGQGL